LNVAAALTVDFGIAVSALITVTDIAAALAIHFRPATGPKVVVTDVAAALTVDFGIAVSALIAVTDVAATSMSVRTQHQQHRNDDSHHSLHGVSGNSLTLTDPK